MIDGIRGVGVLLPQVLSQWCGQLLIQKFRSECSFIWCSACQKAQWFFFLTESQAKEMPKGGTHGSFHFEMIRVL